MKCPNEHEELEKVLFHNVEVDYCPVCLGLWFDQDELRWAKDDKDKQLNWIDFDVWRDRGRFNVKKIDKRCPVCRIPFVEVQYDESSVKINFCKHCQGIWLDRGEFKQIIMYLHKKSDYEILHHYMKNLMIELWEVFSGPEKLREELEDLLMLSKLLSYKFVTKHPYVNSLIEAFPK